MLAKVNPIEKEEKNFKEYFFEKFYHNSKTTE